MEGVSKESSRSNRRHGFLHCANSDIWYPLLLFCNCATAAQLYDVIARPTRQRLSPRAFLEEIARTESNDRAISSQQRLIRQARIGRFKPMADFDWNWPRKIERDL